MRKTNKSVSKRIKITGGKKLMRRKSGQNHFNARNTGQDGRRKHGFQSVAESDIKKLIKYVPFN